jgi:hypothetical protein
MTHDSIKGHGLSTNFTLYAKKHVQKGLQGGEDRPMWSWKEPDQASLYKTHYHLVVFCPEPVLANDSLHEKMMEDETSAFFTPAREEIRQPKDVLDRSDDLRLHE